MTLAASVFMDGLSCRGCFSQTLFPTAAMANLFALNARTMSSWFKKKDLARLCTEIYIEKQPGQGQKFCRWPVRADFFFVKFAWKNGATLLQIMLPCVTADQQKDVPLDITIFNKNLFS